MHLGRKRVTIVHQAAQDVLPQVVLQFLQHSLYAPSHGRACNWTLQAAGRRMIIQAKYDPDRQ